MQSSEIMKFDLLKILIATQTYLTSITQTKESQASFIKSLQLNQYSHLELLELINITPDNLAKSLLITHLLSMKEYYNHLKSDSLLSRLTNNETHSPSRLNALVHQLDVNSLTEEQINNLHPEAAISLLCSIPHFHQLKEEQVDALLRQFPEVQVIQYWLNHYSLMPNAHFTLAHLTRLADAHVFSEVNKMEPLKKEAVITIILEHLELFQPGFKLLHEGDIENYLKVAIKLYLNGQHHPHYVHYIHQIMGQLLSQNHHFSVETVQLLISLNGIEEFSKLKSKTGYLTNYLLRAKALDGDTELFYSSGQINIKNMTQLIQLKPALPTKAPEKSILSGWLYPTKTEEINDRPEQNDIKENPLVDQLAKYQKSVKTFDYYLLHFKGGIAPISKLIKDYLDYYQKEGCTEPRRRTIYHTAILMTRPEVDGLVREAIYTSFLNYPELFDEQIDYWLLRYNAERTIKHFGFQGGAQNYNLIIELCTEALKKLDPVKDAEIIKIATQARSEAQLELAFSKETGFFALLIQRFKRCWISGWTGFFSPKLPTYVAPAHTQPNEGIIDSCSSTEETELRSETREASLAKVLTSIESQYTIQDLDELINILQKSTTKNDSNEELNFRNRINRLFHKLLLDSKDNKDLDGWLIKNQPTFMAIRFSLLDLGLRKGSGIDMALLIKEINEDFIYLQQNNDSSRLGSIMSELNCIMPELKTDSELPKENPPLTTSEPVTLETVASNLWSWAKGSVGSFFTPVTLPTPTLDSRSTPAPQTMK